MTYEVNFAFIIGTGRCGTSLMAQMLNSHSRICVPPELQLIFEYDGNGNRLLEEFTFCGSRGIDPDTLSSIIERCCPHKLELFFDYKKYCRQDNVPRTSLTGFINHLYESIAMSHDKSWLIEQTPWYGQRIDILTDLFPNAKFIHMIRDGRDVALSFARTPWWYESVHLNLSRWQKELKKICLDAALYLNPKSYLEVKYENLVSNPEFELRRICDFLGVVFEAATLDPHRYIDYDEYSRINVSKISSKEYYEWKKNKKTAVFSGNVNAWLRNKPIFSCNLPIEISEWLCRFHYDVEKAGETSEKNQPLCFNANTYIRVLENDKSENQRYIADLKKVIANQTTHIENQADHIKNQDSHIKNQANHIRNIEADWEARGHHIETLEQVISDQTKHIHYMETELSKIQSSWYGKLHRLITSR